MKKFYNMVVRVDQTVTMEKALNRLRIGLNEWDRTRVLYSNGVGYVNYTIICTDETYASIYQVINQC